MAVIFPIDTWPLYHGPLCPFSGG